MRDLRHVVLVGLMGSGKTTVGRLVARRLGWPLVDNDVELGRRIGMTAREFTAREGLDRLAVFLRAADDLVVDVGDIADISHAVAARAQPALHHVENHQDARVTEMAVVVYGHAADVHAHLFLPQRHELLLCPAKGVEDLQD